MSNHTSPLATVVLRMTDLTNTGSLTYNSVGWSNGLRRICGWTKIDLRGILGKSYDDYELFNLVLTNVSSALQTNLPGSTSEDRKLMVYMSGLNWVNQCYDSATKSVSRNALVGNLWFDTGSGTTTKGLIMESPCTFSKSSTLEDWVITLYRNSDGAQPTVGDRSFTFVFTFNIYGVEDINLSHSNGLGKQSNNYLNL